VWRALGAGAYPQIDTEDWLVNGVRLLRNYRLGEGRWRTFPFYYTVLALAEFAYPAVVAELQYARPVLEKAAAGKHTESPVALRRKILAERVLMTHFRSG